jgi:hypothetical protein
VQALYRNTTGTYNTATGFCALLLNTTGSENTAVGPIALFNNSTGLQNTACGYGTLYANTTGERNTAGGWEALLLNTQGAYNTAFGSEALFSHTTGSANTGVGFHALYKNTGQYNVALGFGAGENVTIGSHNIAIGDDGTGTGAGSKIVTGSFNIDIGNDGFQNESNTIRIGTTNIHTKAVFNGIFGTTVGSPATVIVNANGLLGTVSSSRRFKQDIADMDSASEVLHSLRPVSFRYKPEFDSEGVAQFGLIAEEVNEVCPKLVLRNLEGEIYSVRYEQVNAMLLNEFLKDHRRLESVLTENAAMKKRVAELEANDGAMKKQFAELLARQAKLEQFISAREDSPVRVTLK